MPRRHRQIDMVSRAQSPRQGSRPTPHAAGANIFTGATGPLVVRVRSGPIHDPCPEAGGRRWDAGRRGSFRAGAGGPFALDTPRLLAPSDPRTGAGSRRRRNLTTDPLMLG